MANLQENCNPKIKKSVKDLEKFQIKMPEQAGLTHECYRTNELTRPGEYQLTTHNMPECFNEKPGYFVDGYAPSSMYIDIESEFRGLNYRNTRCHTMENDPIHVFRNMKNKKTEAMIDCDPQMNTVYTKRKRTCNNVSLISQNRFDYLSKPLAIQSNTYIGDNSRLMARDLEQKKQEKLDRNPKLPTKCYCGKLPESHFSNDCMYLNDPSNGLITEFFMKKH
jgi:hypothetical protein